MLVPEIYERLESELQRLYEANTAEIVQQTNYVFV